MYQCMPWKSDKVKISSFPHTIYLVQYFSNNIQLFVNKLFLFTINKNTSVLTNFYNTINYLKIYTNLSSA